MLTLLQANYLSLFSCVLRTSTKASIFIIFLLGVKFLLRNKMGARFQYMLWSILVLGLVLPWTPKTPVSVDNFIDSPYIQRILFSISDPHKQSYSTGVATLQSNPDKTVVMDGNPSKAVTNIETQRQSNNNRYFFVISPFVFKLMFFIWCLGASLLMVLAVIINKRFSKRIEHDLVTDQRLLSDFNKLKVDLKIKTEISMLKTRHVFSPSLLGVLHPRLLLPIGIEQTFSLEQINHIFLHELLHFKRKDIWVNWLAQVLATIHWFNPLIWYAFHRMREDQEIACDALVISQIDTRQTKDYAYTLIKLLETYSTAPRMASLARLSGSKSQIKRRLTMIKKFRQASVKWSSLGLLVIAFIALATFSSAKVDASNVTQKGDEVSKALSQATANINSTSVQSTVDASGRRIDSINVPFVDDPRVEGVWTSVDFVSTIDGFNPQVPSFTGDLYLKGLTFQQNGKTTQPWWTWSKGLLLHSGDKTASRYAIETIQGTTYMFLEWKSGDYVIRNMTPMFYVMKKNQI